ncbi:hypothetical protein C5B85_02585 [Pseudoclavibacter sp. AY1F1]|uniref:hypothetical protein n=1 Tax=Pseudoclavibacter sp. AY1F1 TaxID=2080583 RepID=UPI000CE84DD8|nr:hypothetical protein [Pseudoclavibacter sp. AY1F1]PPF47177.1 hypothetical protein C5B85_02585 [Pseudoclavibacter sp. AY1F1]
MADAYLVSGTAAEDASFRALADLTQALDGEENAGVVGGHMVSILCARFPSPGTVERRTNDADGGVPAAFAATGAPHERLLAAGYEAIDGNRYELVEENGAVRTVDLLVPTHSSKFASKSIDGRAFDSMPGLDLALARPLTVDLNVTLSNKSELELGVTLPAVEGAVILKSYAWAGRLATKDAIDLHSLFRVVVANREVIGDWRLDERPPRGARLDTARTLHALADQWETRPPKVTFESRLLVAGVRRHVARPR